jgi:hypothetical protein
MKANSGNYLPTDTASWPRRHGSSATPLWESKISHLLLTFWKWNSLRLMVYTEPALTFTHKTSPTKVYQLSRIKFSNLLMFLWLPSDVAQCVAAVPKRSCLFIHLHFSRVSFLIFFRSFFWISVSSELSFTKYMITHHLWNLLLFAVFTQVQNKPLSTTSSLQDHTYTKHV